MSFFYTITSEISILTHFGLGFLRRNLVRFIVAACIISAVGTDSSVGGELSRSANEIDVRVVSSRPDMVTDGDALIAIAAANAGGLSGLRIFLDETDVTGSFRSASSNSLLGLVKGVPNSGTLKVTDAKGVIRGTLPIENHPAHGPVFSGPHEQPFICETDAFALISGETLGTPTDDSCSIDRRIDYAYLPVGGSDLIALADPVSEPDDVAFATMPGSRNVPFIVRIETGTVNRAIYQIAILHDPATRIEPTPETARQDWNRRLVYTFGGGCVNGWFRQGDRTGGVTDPWLLGQGYAVASASLNVFGNNCNDVLAAETMMMVKERFIEGYGVPRYTIGLGCSGGSYQVHQIADNYPGLLDGIIPGCSFPDVGFSTVPMVTDARLLKHYFANEGSGLFTKKHQHAVSGFLVHETMDNVSHKAGRITIGEFCPDILPDSLRYHRTDNPTGARCELFEHHVNVYGRNPNTGFVRRPMDNIGVQYGLQALNNKAIDPSQFIHLNAHIGGYDIEGRFHPNRTEADPVAVRIAYESGRLTNGGGGLASTPIIDYRAYSDDLENGDIHTRYHSFSMRERLRKANGRTDNHVMLVEDFRYGYYSTESPVLRYAIRQMDQWLNTLTGETFTDVSKSKVADAKPQGLVDSCWSRDREPKRIVETQMQGSGRCDSMYPSPSAPRGVAGAPLAGDIVKCQLKPLDPDDYSISFNAGQVNQLHAIFPEGVCDYDRPGVDQTNFKGTWQTFN